MDYKYIGKRKLKKGYTTGICAAGASKAAVLGLIEKRNIDIIEVSILNNNKLNLKVYDFNLEENYCSCSIVKDSGDDPDITDKIKIFAKAEFIDENEIIVTGGEGVGIVTMPGLKVDVGNYAINPKPLEMIKNEVKKVLGDKRGIKITISVPKGSEISKKTYNPKLGIIGGISILGTTGIVEPMSLDAIKDTIFLEINMIKKRGYKDIVFVFGNYGEDFLNKKLNYKKDNILKISNFIGDALDECHRKGFEKILIAGHIGKLIKVAGGIFQTHSRFADCRMEIITAYAALNGAGFDVINEVYKAKTTEYAADILKNNNLEKVFKNITDNCISRCIDYLKSEIKMEVILFYRDGEILSRSKI
jgi:cobalt-precorrin-5B (C1)-methyltransferase